MEQAISLQSVEKSFHNHQVLAPLTLSLPQGQLIGLLGPSGCGKTTFIKLLMGMLQPDAGTIHIFDTKVPNMRLLKETGYMAQNDALYTDLTGTENLQFFAKLFHLSKSERQQRITYTAHLVRLTNDLNKLVANYSGGMKRRLSLAIALLQNPKLIILDEPTVGIDPLLKMEIWSELTRLKVEEQKTILVTTHAMDEAERCDQLILLKNGKIIAFGTPSQIKKQFQAAHFDDVFIRAGGGLT